jgi:hypothetical protein
MVVAVIAISATSFVVATATNVIRAEALGAAFLLGYHL